MGIEWLFSFLLPSIVPNFMKEFLLISPFSGKETKISLPKELVNGGMGLVS